MIGDGSATDADCTPVWLTRIPSAPIRVLPLRPEWRDNIPIPTNRSPRKEPPMPSLSEPLDLTCARVAAPAFDLWLIVDAGERPDHGAGATPSTRCTFPLADCRRR